LYKRVKIQIYTYKSRHLSPFESQKWFYNLCNPINLDLCCALFFPFFLIENKLNSTEREAQWRTGLKGLQKLPDEYFTRILRAFMLDHFQKNAI